MTDELLIHVMPVGDLKEHIDDVSCWCHPTASIEESHVIIHNSLDGRESAELILEQKELLN